MKKLKDILQGLEVLEVIGTYDQSVGAITSDSRKATLETLFVAVKGEQVDGHQFIGQAITSGSKTIVCQTIPSSMTSGVTYLKVQDANRALGFIAANFYDHPSQQLQLIGITGTNGKTTTASLLYQLFQQLGFSTALLSTISIKIDAQEFATTHTTPDVITINEYLRKAVDSGCSYAFMEVSSHGINQGRIEGLHFAGAVFTNITHDHLDYHKTFQHYLNTKKRFFDQLSTSAFALINIDDRNARVMVQNTKASIYTYAMKTAADYTVKIVESQLEGMLLRIDDQEVWTAIIGKFNAYNLLLTYAVGSVLKQEKLEVLKKLSTLESIKGRFQYMISLHHIRVVIDYAHTPDALINVLETIEEIRTKNEQLIVVVGCGGNRDKEKRPIMASIACRYADQVILTSDNPRFEEPAQIIREMESGIEAQHYNKYLVMEDRKEAIKAAVKMAQSKDIILIAGKGHEDYQEIQGERTPFDDYKVASDLLNLLNK